MESDKYLHFTSIESSIINTLSIFFYFCRDMSNPNVEYLGVMAWAAQFQWIQDKIAPGDRVQIQCNTNKIRVGDEVR